MLNNDQIKDAINKREIELTVFFKKNRDKIAEYESEKNLLQTPSKDNIYSDRLKLSMGPIIKILNNKKVPRKNRFKRYSDCYDLRTSDNKYIIQPGESIIVLTNEKVKLNGDYACIVLPRISLSDVGIVVTTAYVDPYYCGLMRLHLSNFSDKPYELSTLEAIAQCFFFKLSETVNKSFQEHFSEKSVFFGQTWKEIMTSDRDPFPIKKTYVERNAFRKIASKIKPVELILNKHSFFITIGTGVIAFVVAVYALNVKISSYDAVIQHVENILDSSSSEIIINKGTSYGEKEITVDYPESTIISVICNDDDIHYEIFSGNTDDETIIKFSYATEVEVADRRRIPFTYIIVRTLN